MANRGLTPGPTVTGTSANATIPATEAIFIESGGTVAVAGPNTAIISFGSIPANTRLDLSITQVGSITTATIIPLR